MNKIKNIKYKNNYIEIEVKDYVYKIPVKSDYVKKLVNKAVIENKDLYKDIKYYDKCANICLYPIWLAVGLLLYGIMSNFILMNLMLFCCGGITGLSLIGTSIFKIASKKLKDEANNNEYFTKLYEYALTGKKESSNERTKQTVKSNVVEKNTPAKSSNIRYHLVNNEIMQDEVNHTRKR